MDTGSDFIRPEFLNILFFQQKNLVIFPYVDKKHLHALEIFTVGHTVVDIESTALNNIREIIEFESSNSYAQNSTLFFIENVGKKQLEQLLQLDSFRCIINTNEIIGDLANGSKFIFFNKKHGQFINYDENDEELLFERELISSSENEELLQEQIQKIKIAASLIFRDLNQTGNLQNLPEILKDFDEKYWDTILNFTGKYYDIIIPERKNINRKSKPKVVIKDFSDEYGLLISTNKTIGKEFIQLLHDYRSKKVNPSNLELEELFNPLKLYNYMRNHHWKNEISEDFIQEWIQMKNSGYTLTDSDKNDFNTILESLGLPEKIKSLAPKQQSLDEETPRDDLRISNLFPSNHTDWDKFQDWLMSRLDNLEYVIDEFIDTPPKKISNPKLAEVNSLICSEISTLNNLLSPYRVNKQRITVPKTIGTQLDQTQKTLLVDITNILNLDKNKNGKIKVSNISRLRDSILEIGYIPKLWADASMRHWVDDKEFYQELLQKKIVKEAPAGIEADMVVLKLAKKYNYKFLANDLYRDYQNDFGRDWIHENRLTCVYNEGEFIILEKS